METTLTINSIEAKTAKSGKEYFSVVTTAGNMTVFDKPIIDELKKNIGKEIVLEVEESKGFKNIRAFIKVHSTQVIKPTDQQTIENFAEPRKLKDICEYTKMAIDLFIALKKEIIAAEPKMDNAIIMEYAVGLVKKAKEKLKEE